MVRIRMFKYVASAYGGNGREPGAGLYILDRETSSASVIRPYTSAAPTVYNMEETTDQLIIMQWTREGCSHNIIRDARRPLRSDRSTSVASVDGPAGKSDVFLATVSRSQCPDSLSKRNGILWRRQDPAALSHESNEIRSMVRWQRGSLEQ